MKQSIVDRQTPIGFYNFAASYHVAGDLICDQGLRATHPESPAMFLYYHAIELYLKSFLRFHGVSAKCLKSIGHDYKRLLSKASQCGLVLGDIENEVLNMLDGKLWSRSRYLETGFFRGPSLYALSETSKSLRREVSKVLRDAGQPVRMPAHKKSKPCAHWGIEPGPINDGQKPDHDLWPERRRHLNGGRSDQGNERELESGTQTIG